MPKQLSEEYTKGAYRRFFDIPYCENAVEEQVLDLWLPEKDTEKPLPVILYFHGGGFSRGAKREDQSEPVIRAVNQGYAVADVEYRKSGTEVFPAMLYDAKAAVRFLRAHAEKYHLDPDRIAVWGASAGGWISGMMAVTGGNPAFEDLAMGNSNVSGDVQAVVDWCGPCGDFYRMDSDFLETPHLNPTENHSDDSSAESVFLGAPVYRSSALCRMAAPVTYANPDVPPVLIVHGAEDRTVPVAQSRRFAGALKESGAGDVELHILPDFPHHSRVWNTSEEVCSVTMDFLNRVLK